MSLVIAIRDKDRIVLGADKQASTGGTKDHTNTKIWRIEELPGAIIGSVGAARASQIIQYSQIIDKNLLSQDLDTEFVVRILAPTLAKDRGVRSLYPRPWTVDSIDLTAIDDHLAAGNALICIRFAKAVCYLGSGIDLTQSISRVAGMCIPATVIPLSSKSIARSQMPFTSRRSKVALPRSSTSVKLTSYQ